MRSNIESSDPVYICYKVVGFCSSMWLDTNLSTQIALESLVNFVTFEQQGFFYVPKDLTGRSNEQQ